MTRVADIGVGREQGVAVWSADESEDGLQFLDRAELFLQRIDAFVERSFALAQLRIETSDLADRRARHATLEQSARIHTAQAVARRHRERQHIELQLGAGNQVAVRSDLDEGLRVALAEHHAARADLGVSREAARTSEEHAVADPTIVGDMHLVHDIASLAEGRLAAALLRAAVDRRMFPDDAACADLQASVLAVIFKMFRLRSQRAERKDMAALAQRHRSRQHHMRGDNAILPHADTCADLYPRADLGGRGNSSATIDSRPRMDAHRTQSLLFSIIAMISPSATISPATLASP